MLIIIISAFLLIFITVAVIVIYNELVTLRSRTDNQSAQIDVQLKRRAELIPNLIETVKGYAKFEKTTLTDVAKLRSSMINPSNTKDAIAADTKLSRICTHIFATAENYPELKTNTNFLKLQEEFSETENKVVMARQFYNDTATKYNIAIHIFPKSIVAGIFGFKEKELLEASDSERKAVMISNSTFENLF